jgi:hypothetical protein
LESRSRWFNAALVAHEKRDAKRRRIREIRLLARRCSVLLQESGSESSHGWREVEVIRALALIALAEQSRINRATILLPDGFKIIHHYPVFSCHFEPRTHARFS